jgi:hypothetical protein
MRALYVYWFIMYKLKLMFEWGGDTIWCANDGAREKYGVGSIEENLPLPREILQTYSN